MSSNTERLMVLGTGSGVGKSSVVTGLARWLANRGRAVAPFKAQNMSNNSMIAREGGEIATSQAIQAHASRQTPSVNFNPILLKPTGEGESEVLVHGEPQCRMSWESYRNRHETMKNHVMNSFERLTKQYDTVLMEGAGSPAEPNLMDQDLVNLPMARRADAPVLLVGDISRGGVFAWLTGTLELMEPHQRDRVEGFIINKFRGDASVLDPAITEIESRTGVPVLGVVPRLDEFRLPSEDSMQVKRLESDAKTTHPIEVGIVRFPRISNFTDFEPLASHPTVTCDVLKQPSGDFDLVILPGTKHTIGDYKWFRKSGFPSWLRGHLDNGGSVLGICGGYQMMGHSIKDPDQVESSDEPIAGLGLFEFEVEFSAPKLTRTVQGTISESGTPFDGYEIRYGRFSGGNGCGWLCSSSGEILGRRSEQVYGTSVHGVFRRNDFVNEFLNQIGDTRTDDLQQTGDIYDRWAERLTEHLDTDALDRILQQSNTGVAV